ncbi:hypothetical protein ACLK17_14000 [Escherichia coli]
MAQTLGWPLIGDVLSQTGQPLPCADFWLGNAKATSQLAAGANCGATGKQPDGQTAPAMAGKL